MKYSVDWQDLNGDSFQELCNHLLHFDVSKDVRVFTAPGKDKGIDAELKGTIDGKQVWWRFQAKYHSPSAKSAQSDFKRQVAKDVAKNWHGEDRVIFLTSIEIGPIAQERIIKDAIEEMKTDGQVKPEIVIWDKAELEVRLTMHPIILQRFWGNRGAILTPYKVRFARQLDPGNEEPFFFNKPFWGRKKELSQLIEFLEDDGETLRCIVGAGGYGKTRLCINFFQTVIDPHREFEAFVLVSGAFDAAGFEFILRGADKLVILIDDAHNESSIQSIVQVAERPEFKGKIKLLLTTRTSLFPQLSEKFPDYDQVKADIKVGALGEDEAFKGVEKFLLQFWANQPESEVKDNFHINDILMIVSLAGGMPLLIMMVVHEICLGRSYDAIHKAKNYSLAEFVWKYVDQEISHVAKKAYAEKQAIKQAIQILAFVSPLAKPQMDAISEWLDLNEGQLEELLQILEEGGLIEIIHKDTRLFYWRDENGKPVLQRGQYPTYFRFPEELMPLKVREEDLIYNFRPDPFRDIIIEGFTKEKKKLTAMISSETGMAHFQTLFQNLFNVFQYKEAKDKRFFDLFAAFSKNLKNHICPPDYLEQLILKTHSFGKMIDGFGAVVFEQVLDLLEEKAHPLNLPVYGSDQKKTFYGEFKRQLHEIFDVQVLKGALIDDTSFDQVIRLCKATNSMGLLMACSASRFVPYKGTDFSNALFIQKKIETRFLKSDKATSFGLMYLGWSVGIYSKHGFGGHQLDAPFWGFDHGMVKQVLTQYRKDVFQKLVRYSGNNMEQRWLVANMFLSHLDFWAKLVSGLEKYSGFDFDAFMLDSVAECKLIFRYLIDFARENTDVFRKVEFMRRAMHLRYPYPPPLAPMFGELLTILESAGSPGEGLALALISPWRELYHHWAKIDAYLRKIDSVEQLIDELKTGRTTFAELEKGKFTPAAFGSWSDVYWRVVEVGTFSLPDLYLNLLNKSPEQIWESGGELLAGIRFSETADLEAFFEIIDILLGLKTPLATKEIIRAYFPVSRFEVWKLWEERDKAVLDRILDLIPEIPSDLHSPIVSFYVILASFVRYDAAWTLSRMEKCFEVFDHFKVDIALHHLYDQEKESAGAVPFLTHIIEEQGHRLDFYEHYHTNNEIFAKAFSRGSDERLKKVLIRFFNYRFAQNAPPVSLHRSLLERNLNDPLILPSEQSKRARYQRFRETLSWYLSLDFDTEKIFIDDAWQLLRFFRPENWTPRTVTKILKTANKEILAKPKGRFHLLTAYYIFEDQNRSSYISKRLSDFLAILGHSVPAKEEIPQEYQNVKTLKSIPRYVQIKNAYQQILVTCPYTQVRVRNFFRDLCGMIF